MLLRPSCRHVPCVRLDAPCVLPYKVCMHEMALAENIWQIVRETMVAHGMRVVCCVRVRVGALSHVVPDALRLGFGALAQDTPWPAARLEVLVEPVLLACGDCGRPFQPANPRDLCAPCPWCGCVAGHGLERGEELTVVDLEAE